MCQLQASSPSDQAIPVIHSRRSFWKHGGRVAALISLFAGLVGLWIGFVELEPALSVSAAHSLAADDLYEPRFTVTNVGYLTVYDLGFGCLVTMPIKPKVAGPMSFDLGIHNRANEEAGNNTMAEPFLAPQDSVVKTCPTKVTNNTPGNISLAGATIDFFTSYRPFVPFYPSRQRVVRFVSRIDPGGGVVWIPARYYPIGPPMPPFK
jgi:hypothetical protein